MGSLKPNVVYQDVHGMEWEVYNKTLLQNGEIVGRYGNNADALQDLECQLNANGGLKQ